MGPWIARAGKLAIRYGPKVLPQVAEAAGKTSQRLSNREKAISHAEKIGGRFAEVWIEQERYWIVEKDGAVVNHFPKFAGDEERIRKAVLDLAAGQLRDPHTLLRSKVRDRRPK